MCYPESEWFMVESTKHQAISIRTPNSLKHKLSVLYDEYVLNRYAYHRNHLPNCALTQRAPSFDLQARMVSPLRTDTNVLRLFPFEINVGDW